MEKRRKVVKTYKESFEHGHTLAPELATEVTEDKPMLLTGLTRAQMRCRMNRLFAPPTVRTLSLKEMEQVVERVVAQRRNLRSMYSPFEPVPYLPPPNFIPPFDPDSTVCIKKPKP